MVIPTWNAPELTVQAVDHLTRDGIPEWGELIVVNDGSDDDTSARARSRCPEVTVIDHATNRGFGAAVNTGFKAAKGEFLAAVNNDALVTWDTLERIASFLETQTRAAAGAPQILDPEGNPQRVGLDIPRSPWQRLAGRNAMAAVRPAASTFGSEAPYPAGYLKGACVVFARPALADVGLFDEQFHMFAEEIDLFNRLLSAGWTAWVLPEVHATHFAGLTTRNHSDPAKAKQFRLRSYRSMCLYYRKHHTWPTATVLRGLLATRLFGRFLGALASPAIQWDAPRGPREQLSCLATVLSRCRSTPVQPSL